MKYILSLLLIVVTVIPATKWDVYEALSSEDVNLFINDDPHKNRAIMFYDEIQEISQKGLHKRDDKIISIFLGKGEKNRLKEDWVDELKDGFNIMLNLKILLNLNYNFI